MKSFLMNSAMLGLSVYAGFGVNEVLDEKLFGPKQKELGEEFQQSVECEMSLEEKQMYESIVLKALPVECSRYEKQWRQNRNLISDSNSKEVYEVSSRQALIDEQKDILIKINDLDGASRVYGIAAFALGVALSMGIARNRSLFGDTNKNQVCYVYSAEEAKSEIKDGDEYLIDLNDNVVYVTRDKKQKQKH